MKSEEVYRGKNFEKGGLLLFLFCFGQVNVLVGVEVDRGGGGSFVGGEEFYMGVVYLGEVGGGSSKCGEEYRCRCCCQLHG